MLRETASLLVAAFVCPPTLKKKGKSDPDIDHNAAFVNAVDNKEYAVAKRLGGRRGMLCDSEGGKETVNRGMGFFTFASTWAKAAVVVAGPRLATPTKVGDKVLL